jgi:hypothetical protein
LNKVEVVGGDALSSNDTDEVVCYGGKADRTEVGVIRGGGKASDAERIVETWRSRNSLTPATTEIVLVGRQVVSDGQQNLQRAA